MTFAERAEILISRGIPVIPVNPGTKACTKFKWNTLATTDLARIKAWNSENPAYNTGAVAKKGGYLILDIDDVVIHQQLLLAGIDLAEIRTFKVVGKKLAPCGHCYFLQTEASNALPNCDLRVLSRETGKKLRTLFDLKGHNAYVVGPRSIHPDGPEYRIVDDSPIVPIPDLLVSFLATHTGAIWEGVGKYGPQDEGGKSSERAQSSRPGTLRERVEAILAYCLGRGYEEVKSFIGGYGYAHRHEADAAIANYLFVKYAGDYDKVAEEFQRVRLHWERGASYDQLTLSKAKEWYDAGCLPGANGRSASAEVLSDAEPSPTRAHEWPEAPDRKAFFGLAGDIVHALEPYSEADPTAHLGQLLVGYGSAIGRRPFFRVEDDWHFLNEFLALVGPTAKARKGTSWSSIRRLVEECDPTWAPRVMPGLSSGEGVVHQIRDATGQGKDMDPGEPDKRLMIVEPELASVIATMGRQGNTLSPVLRQGWDGGRLGNLTKKTSETCVAPHISLNGHITVEELRRSLDRTELANGFANRFLFACVRRSKLLPDGARLPGSLRQQLVGRLRTAMTFARSVGEMTRDEQAQELWRKVYEPLSEGRAGLFGAIIARAEAHVVRLSCLYALLNLSPIVALDHLEAALAFWKYSEDSAQYIFGDATGDPVADGILSALRNNPDGLTRTAISELFSRNQSKARIDAALSSLRGQGRAYVAKRRSAEGRTTDVWFVK